LMAERDSLSVVADQRGTPTWADSLASAIWAFVAAPKLAGIFHWTDGGDCTWHDFAVAIQAEALSLGLLQREIPILAVTTDKYPTAAPRPGYTVMDCSGTWAVLDRRPNPWRENLRRMLEGMVS
ncbi:MAG: NAD(P)-dependent oxidoreductase, partial [Gemmatimonadota bacterium]|nr:NAD(P)-dependent oxidoreductase [Gemmatimonadota bacterium]